MRLLARATVAVVLGVLAVGASAASATQAGATQTDLAVRSTGLDPTLFPEPAILRPAVHFWEDVFGKYSNNQSLLHSTIPPIRVIRVLDFKPDISKSARRKRERHATKSAENDLKKIVAADADPSRISARARRLYTALGGGDTAKFKALEGSLRIQRGLRERTHSGLAAAGRYLPRMRNIFSNYDLPTALTRLPIVESSFDLSAYSKVGAAGIWQFMPGSARIYMTLNAVQDDRRDPWTSTDAAARLLRDNYAALGSWPLAITAYNYGRAGVQRALSAIDGKTLADLIKHYDGARFGFASSNFYAEFLAASAVAEHTSHYFDDIERATPINFDVVTTRNYVPYQTLQRISGASRAQFKTLNPAFSTAARKDRLYVPPGTTVRVPAGHEAKFKRLYAALGPGQRFSRQRVWYVAYRVQRGDVLGRIAHRHHVSVRQIMRMNHLRSARHIRAGQVLRIPTGGNAPRLVAAATPPHRGRVIVHRVRRGQTLSGIAAHYHVSVRQLMRANQLHNARAIRAGQRLRIPTGRGGHLVAAATHSAGKRVVTHRVRRGQTLSGIAAHYHVSVHQLMAANQLHSARHIRTGQELRIPTGQAGHLVAAADRRVVTHRVSRGQTLSGIAARHHSSVRALRRTNHLRDADKLRVGMVLKIPR